MQEELQVGLLKLVALFGGWAVVTTAVSVWLSKLAADRLAQRWTEKHQIALELVRADIARDQGLLNTAISAFNAGHAASNERRFQAIEELWRAVVRLRERQSPMLTIADILQPDEYGELFTNRNFVAQRNALTIESISAMTMYATGSLETHRPFLGEFLWAHFFAYRAFIARSTYLLMPEGQLRLETYVHWSKDDGIRKLLSAVLTGAELQELVDAPASNFHGVQQAIERKMLEYANRVVTGESAADLGLAQAARIQQAANELRIEADQD